MGLPQRHGWQRLTVVLVEVLDARHHADGDAAALGEPTPERSELDARLLLEALLDERLGSDEDRREFFEPRAWVLESCRVVVPIYQQLGMSLLAPWDVNVAAHAPDEKQEPVSSNAPPLVVPRMLHFSQL
jgi:hypothetical protein